MATLVRLESNVADLLDSLEAEALARPGTLGQLSGEPGDGRGLKRTLSFDPLGVEELAELDELDCGDDLELPDAAPPRVRQQGAKAARTGKVRAALRVVRGSHASALILAPPARLAEPTRT
jgi:hypothetical protein